MWTDIVAPSLVPPPASSTLVVTISTIHAAVAASQECERAATLALLQERAMGAALTTQMAAVQRLLGVRPLVAPEASHTSGLGADTVAALHAQATRVHNIRSRVSVVFDPASSHYPRWCAQVILTL